MGIEPKGVYAYERLNSKWYGRRALGKSCCCQPDPGNSSVRDESGACGNVSYGSRAEAQGEIYSITL